eukprot:TRINITY_DN91902_c0_g1_i1.p1 TRINITY_DN91902_c0_g1~~TRINITY_DN91902_c0_g1_i1.p1  ORF type:complete len:1055 (+),score=387.08 TRINITY_DN91902_c0_g1_i1:77-3241(+)
MAAARSEELVQAVLRSQSPLRSACEGSMPLSWAAAPQRGVAWAGPSSHEPIAGLGTAASSRTPTIGRAAGAYSGLQQRPLSPLGWQGTGGSRTAANLYGSGAGGLPATQVSFSSYASPVAGAAPEDPQQQRRSISPAVARPPGASFAGAAGTLGSGDALSLQRRLDSEAATKETAKLELAAIARTVELQLKQLLAACDAAARSSDSSSSKTADRIVRNISALCSDVQERQHQWTISAQAMLGDGSSLTSQGGRSYEVLRQSLESSQKRCTALNNDMMKVAEANEELLSTMQAVKATNRRLVDQIQSQSEEITRLTQFRVTDESSIEELTDAFRKEAGDRRQDLDARLRHTEADYEARFQKRRGELVGQLHHMKEALQGIGGQLSELRAVHSAAAGECKGGFSAWRAETLERCGRALVDRLASEKRDGEAALTRLEDEVHARTVRLEAEKDVRQREEGAWKERLRELTEQNKELASTLDAEAARLRQEMQAAEESRSTDAAALQKEHGGSVSSELRDLTFQTASLAAKLDSARAAAAATQAKCMRAETEGQLLDEQWRATHERLRKSDGAFDQAVAANEELRRTIEEQRSEGRLRCDDCVTQCLAAFDMSLKQLQATQNEDLRRLNDRLGDLEQASVAQAGSMVRLELEAESAGAEKGALQRDCALWKAQEEQATKLKAEVEKELAENRKEWTKRLAELREQQDVLSQRQQQLGSNLSGSRDALVGFQQGADVRSMEVRDYAKALNAKLQETEDALATAKGALQEKMASLASLKNEVSMKHASALETKHELEQQLQKLAHEAAERRETLLAEAGQEWQRAQRAQRDAEESFQRSQYALHEVHGDCGMMVQITSLEQSVADIRERNRLEKMQAARRMEAQRDRAEGLEKELAQTHALLDDTEKMLQVETAAMKQDRQDGEAVVERLRLEMDAAKEKAVAAQEQCQQLQGELEELERSCAGEKARHDRELGDLQRGSEQKRRESAQRLESERRSREADLVGVDGRLRAEADRQRVAMEAVESDNRRLRRLVGDRTGTRAALAALAAAPGPRALSATR